MSVLQVLKEHIKQVPLLARPLRACKRHVLSLAGPAPMLIEAHRGIPSLRLRELWDFRDLLFIMALRDFQVRYRQTILGIAWAIVPTLMTALVFGLFFRKIARIDDSNQLPYAAFYFAAVLPWNFFTHILTQSSVSLTQNFNLLQKMYFPRLVLPLKSVLVASVDLLLSSSLLVGTVAYYWYFYGLTLSINIVWLPLFLLLALMTGLGVGLWFAAANVYFRDVANFLPYCMQFWFFVTPIFYSDAILSEPWRTLIKLNPMTCVVSGCRWALFNDGSPPGIMALLVFNLTLLMTVGGLYFFRKVERTIADVV